MGISPVAGEFPAQMASNAEMFSFDDVIMRTMNSSGILVSVRRAIASHAFLHVFCGDSCPRSRYGALAVFHFLHCFLKVMNLTQWAFCQVRKFRIAHAPGMPGTFSPPPRVSDPDMHHGTCMTHVP